MDRNAVISYLKEDWEEVGKTIRDVLQSDIDLLNLTNSKILSRSGKMLRPMLSLCVARACSADGAARRDSVLFASASELLHNATLLHDDVADAASTRRGAPTVNSLLGGRASVLLGDFWLVRAVELILRSEKNSSRVINVFSKTLSDLAEGEMLQLQKASSADTTEEDYLRIIHHKTASLFEAACVSAAISVDADEDVINAVRNYAYYLGLAFQIKDDIMDYAMDESIGKPVGADIMEQKITMPLLCALATVDEQKEKEIRSMVKAVSDNPECGKVVIDFVHEHDGAALAGEKLDEMVDRALQSLESLPDSQAREYLVELARYSAQRSI